MGRANDEYGKQPQIVGNRRLMRFLGIVLIFGSPLWLDMGWVVASWWRPIVGIGPQPGFPTPFLDIVKTALGMGSTNLGDAWANARGTALANPTRGLQIFFMVAVGSMLVMKRRDGL